MVRVIGPPSDAVTLGDVILQALGIAGVLTMLAVVFGLALGAIFIIVRRRNPLNPLNGDSSGDLSLHLTE